MQQKPPHGAATDAPSPTADRHAERRYRLEVAQQPQRARMCGLGEKDRRAITPLPLVSLGVFDRHGTRIAADDVDVTFFVCQVDLVDRNGHDAVMARDTHQAPPAATVHAVHAVPVSVPVPNSMVAHQRFAAYPPQSAIVPDPAYHAHAALHAPPQMHPHPHPHAPSHPHLQAHLHAHAQAHPHAHPQVHPHAPHPHAQPHPHQHLRAPPPPGVAYRAPPPPVMAPMAPVPPHDVVYVPTVPDSSYHRNLIGSLTVNAHRLEDDKGTVGIWFIFQDLSIRSEGQFRLRFKFIDVGEGGEGGEGAPSLNRGRAPVLATCMSSPFDVFTAKRFPGMVEPTELSRAFAKQGIKITIRKDTPLRSAADADADDDDD